MSLNLYKVECWQRATLLVLSEDPKKALEDVKDPKNIVGTVGYGEIHNNGITVKEPGLAEVAKAEPMHQGVVAAKPS